MAEVCSLLWSLWRFGWFSNILSFAAFETALVPVGVGKWPQHTVPTILRPGRAPPGNPVLSVDRLTGPGGQWKVLLHLVVWRHLNQGALLPAGLEISHYNVNNSILDLVAESHELNESRKWCKVFGWHIVQNQFIPVQPVLCPHTYCPCTNLLP